MISGETSREKLSLKSLDDVANYDRVTVEVKVVDLAAPTVLDDGRNVQNVLVSTPKQDANIELIDDLSQVAAEVKKTAIKNVRIVGVTSLYSISTPLHVLQFWICDSR